MQSLIAHSPTGSRRRAFTLIELLIVIAVIGILAGLLLGGVFDVFGRTREVQVTAEIGSLEKGIQDFQLRFGIDPPSFVVLYEDNAGWSTVPPTTVDWSAVPFKKNKALVQRLFPDLDLTVDHDINLDGDATDVFVLQGSECLVFFLGGNGLLSSTNAQPLGFSTNPANPFGAGGQRIGPFYQFDTARLLDIDGDLSVAHTASTGPIVGALGGREYLDPIPGQLLPYQYFSSYSGTGYRPFGYNGVAGTADDEILSQGVTPVIQGIYMVNDQKWPNAMPPGRPQATAAEYINPKTYQIISPGQDFQFGAGGTYISGQGLILLQGAADSYRSRDARKPEFDNITNFAGLLGEQTVERPAI